MEGHPLDVETVLTVLTTVVQRFEEELAQVELKVHPDFFEQNIGRMMLKFLAFSY